jgi:hypothetical protein
LLVEGPGTLLRTTKGGKSQVDGVFAFATHGGGGPGPAFVNDEASVSVGALGELIVTDVPFTGLIEESQVRLAIYTIDLTFNKRAVSPNL